jgi:hypothetical protein
MSFAMKNNPDQLEIDRNEKITHGKHISFQAMEIPGQRFDPIGLGQQATPSTMLEADDTAENRGVTGLHNWLIQEGIHKAPDKVLTQDERDTKAMEVLDEVRRAKLDQAYFENGRERQEEEEEDDEQEDEEETELERIRRVRREELKAKHHQSKSPFSSVVEIEAKHFKLNVLAPSHDGFVIMLIYKRNDNESEVLSRILDHLAHKFGGRMDTPLRFMKMLCSSTILNFPPEDAPCILTYRNGVKISQRPRLASFGGVKHANVATVEWRLLQDGPLQGLSLMQENPLEDKNTFNINKKPMARRFVDNLDSDSDYDV